MLVATDGSETARLAVERAAELASGTGARVHVITAYRPLAARVEAGRAVDPEISEWRIASDAKADAVLDEACSTLRLRGVEAEPHARSGDPADAILDLAEQLDADLIVVGNKGLSGARRFLLGSVPNKVSHHAPCDVLIVHTS
ncbi:MAG TPA: universal stress protein [Thermoleophilaceae bacterium]|nr:universal stress protein [Thermoleophilaceae bacterium]